MPGRYSMQLEVTRRPGTAFKIESFKMRRPGRNKDVSLHTSSLRPCVDETRLDSNGLSREILNLRHSQPADGPVTIPIHYFSRVYKCMN